MPMAAAAVRCPYALCVSKDGDARFLGHLDFARLIERSLRRSGLPVQRTQGFNPRFKVSFSDALPVGLASEGELITLTLDEDLPTDRIADQLRPVMPECVRLVGVSAGKPPAADRVRYRLQLSGDTRSAADALTALLARDGFLVEDGRHPLPVDARAVLHGGEVADGCLLLDLLAANHGSPRPAPVVAALQAISRQAGLPPWTVGIITKLCAPARQGDEGWDAAAGADRTGTRAASCSSMPARARKAG
jgi:radical SAM-linked protein